ncbi:MAG: sugar phosphate nucleotidyltransferase [Nitrososphaeria archaeon]
MIKKVVIPAAGLGTRLLPVTKEMPKEMLPVASARKDGSSCLKPMLHAIFEQLYNEGFREFVFIVGRGKRAIEDYFSPDYNFVEHLNKRKNRNELALELEEFYEKIKNSTIVFINQPIPLGFGDAVHRAAIFTQNEPFLLHAGDDLIISQNNDHIKRIIQAFKNYDADAIFLIEKVKNPQKYGVIKGEEISPNIFKVTEVVEKPKKPPSNLAIVAIYIFKPIIYKAIEKIEPDENGEIQLTDAIQLMINWQYNVYAVKLKDYEKRIDIGTAENYIKTLKTTVRLL